MLLGGGLCRQFEILYCLGCVDCEVNLHRLDAGMGEGVRRTHNHKQVGSIVDR